MPMIDVHAPAGLIPAAEHAELARSLTAALLQAERRPNTEPYASNTAAFIHELPAAGVHTAARPEAAVVRVDVTTPPGALDRDGQRQLVAEATRLVADAAGEPELSTRTWVILHEAAEGGWGVAGQALGTAEFAVLAAATRAECARAPSVATAVDVVGAIAPERRQLPRTAARRTKRSATADQAEQNGEPSGAPRRGTARLNSQSAGPPPTS